MAGVLANNRTLRLFTIFILYIAQGVPIGLFWYAIPAWMAAEGASPQDIAWVLGLTALPWSLKFVNGLLMDRYSFLPMGRRRAWILGAQLVMIALFLLAAIIQPSAQDVLLLGTLGFLGNAATTFQDVGVDGMAVDLLQPGERAKGGGMMFGGQLIGTAAATAGTGWVISVLGASGAYLVAAVAIALVTIYIAQVREREGERKLPWSPGEAHTANLEVQLERWWPLLKQTVIALLAPLSLLWAIVLVTRGTQYGVMAAVTPVIGVSEAGLSEAQVTALTGLAQLIAGALGLTLGSWLGTVLGCKRALILLLLCWVAFNTAMALSQPLWADPGFSRWFIPTWFALDTVLTVVSIPISMRLCARAVAATQFTIYMAITNMGIAIGTFLFGMADRLGDFVDIFPIMVGINLLALMLMLLVPFPRRAANTELATDPA